jgi:hypothetical protein
MIQDTPSQNKCTSRALVRRTMLVKNCTYTPYKDVIIALREKRKLKKTIRDGGLMPRGALILKQILNSRSTLIMGQRGKYH